MGGEAAILLPIALGDHDPPRTQAREPAFPYFHGEKDVSNAEATAAHPKDTSASAKSLSYNMPPSFV